jgi:hypothetical protein
MRLTVGVTKLGLVDNHIVVTATHPLLKGDKRTSHIFGLTVASDLWLKLPCGLIA